ncbi:large subunit ribosomal protein L7/L12 [Mycolicibacterium sp. BK556]|uniref:ribosomal protein L7/L12 n=1 Tax=Mycobacteriaceae TaxID=1762 RepID=UPI00106070B6|nr:MULTISPECIES: ribosomal protein L7/L12 [Mycobacteriaceae]MBB3605135.1 large subunit ribosomal protein L7/L12 [Mycolicibacterium sp. BK556]MBB3635331.1 large subunit ribosomal protein L7/L12 [Mycolicibacterium sp. BK607]TDO07991.1 ribosomal L7/L12-like protein [Mycobacterium sp. BK086]
MGIFGRSDNVDDVDDGGLRRRVDELERRVAALEWALRGAGAPPAPTPAPAPAATGQVSSEVLQLARQGKKIQAIKVLREQTGLGLKESKDIVDALDP